MSITDELRAWAKEHLSRSSILAIADRIDAEHERAMYDMRREHDEWVADRDAKWVTMPLDADGEPIHVGDVMEWPDGETFDVIGIGDGVLFYTESECDGPAEWTGASTKRHYHAPTVEDVLREMLYKAHIYDEREMELLPDLIADYAKRLTLADGEDA